MAAKAYLAIDLGASSGRHVAGTFDGRRLQLEELYRFENGPIEAAGHLHWDLLNQWQHVKHGLHAAASKLGSQLVSVGVDTWGVDFGLLGRNDELLGNPVCYRDSRTTGMLDRAFGIVPKQEIFDHTGLQFMQINTLYHLLAMRLQKSPLLEVAETFLMMPDLFHWLLTGEKTNEFTNATTTQLFDPCKRTWAYSLLERFGLPTHLFRDPSMPGSKLGTISAAVANELSLPPIQVVLPGTHDTASAVMAVPYAGKPSAKPNWCYISSGTWSLMGVEVSKPVINEKCLSLNFTNEGGVEATIRLLKNIAGLWLVQECRRIWKSQGKEYSWEHLAQMAAAAPARTSLINPDSPEFLAPADMPAAIQAYCRRTSQTVPADAGTIIRCVIDSLALRYRQVLQSLEDLVGERLEVIHIVGGGSQNRVLSQTAADACNRPVICGPVEATAIGNILQQAISFGDLANISEARQIVAESFGVAKYDPRDIRVWDEAYLRFVDLP